MTTIDWDHLEPDLRERAKRSEMTDVDLPPMTKADLFFRDLLADAMTAALADQWRDRARVLRAARPRPGDFPGQQTVEQLRARWRRLTRLAEACEAKADLIDDAQGTESVRTLTPELEDFDLWQAA